MQANNNKIDRYHQVSDCCVASQCSGMLMNHHDENDDDGPYTTSTGCSILLHNATCTKIEETAKMLYCCFVYIYVSMYVCMHVYMYTCMYVHL